MFLLPRSRPAGQEAGAPPIGSARCQGAVAEGVCGKQLALLSQVWLHPGLRGLLCQPGRVSGASNLLGLRKIPPLRNPITLQGDGERGKHVISKHVYKSLDILLAISRARVPQGCALCPGTLAS